MAKGMKWMTAASFLLTAVFTGICFCGYRWAMSWAITFGTFFYHLAMRLLVGHIINAVMKNRADYTKRRYQLWGFEVKFYKKLKVKQWKGNFPTYDPTLFDPKLHSWDEIVQAMCQAELVHEVIVILSFLPLFAAIPFGSFYVFFITSLLAALFDLCFVVIQRYNRPRVLKLLQHSERRK